MRVLGEEYHRRYGRPFVVENRAGGGMNIGGRACAEAPNDGSTICNLPNATLTYNQLLYKKLPYDPERFEPITNPFFNTQLLVVSTALGVTIARRAGGAVEGQARHPELHGAVRAARRCSWTGGGPRAAPTWCGCRSRAAGIPSTACCRARRRSRSSASATGCRMSRPAPCARSRSTATIARRWCPTCRPSASSAMTPT